MLVYSERLTNTPILSLQTGTTLASTDTKLLIDPRRLHVTAFYCHGPLLDISPAILHTADIREFSDIGFIVDDSDSIMSPDDLVRLEEIIQYKFELLGMKVVDTNSKKLGKVSDYVVEIDSYFVKKIIVKRPLFQALNNPELIIDREQIAEIQGDTIIVKAPNIRVEQSEENRQSIVNPFRKQDPHAEGTPPLAQS